MKPKKNSGNILLGALISLPLALLAFTSFTGGITVHQKRVIAMDDEFIATAYVTELLEFFLAQTTQQLKTYLMRPNPTNGSAALNDNYFACAHYNVLDRNTGTIVNGNPVADLPTGTGLDQEGPTLKANRFFQIQIINNNTMTIDTAPCAYRWRQIFFPFEADPLAEKQITLQPGQRFFVTVGVSWIPKGGTMNDAKHVVLSGMVPYAYKY